MKVAKLEGAELDYWVAMALGYGADGIPVNGSRPNYRHPELGWFSLWCPSADWVQAGPIIEQYLIICLWDGAEHFKWWASPQVNDDDILIHGETYLIAAMRCLVEMKFGEEVPNMGSV